MNKILFILILLLMYSVCFADNYVVDNVTGDSWLISDSDSVDILFEIVTADSELYVYSTTNDSDIVYYAFKENFQFRSGYIRTKIPTKKIIECDEFPFKIQWHFRYIIIGGIATGNVVTFEGK